MQSIACYDIFELALTGPQDGNPFLEVSLSATFQLRNRMVEVEGFYDGEGIYRLRCMPDRSGVWRYTTHSSHPDMDGISGEFNCTAPRPEVHGPVRVAERFHFAYDDGSRYIPVGTTCYAWVHQGDQLEEQTLDTLRQAAFNKMRMCVFPKDYAYNKNEPPTFPFEKDTQGAFDLTRFNPAFWRHFEQRVVQLGELGIEADLILFHPYDRWGFANMPAEADDRYLRYAAARLSAYRNVWWSLANEYDLMRGKSMSDWDRFFRILQEYDPVQHLRSIHNCRPFYNHAKSWVTHTSVQHADTNRVREWREEYGKPVVVDECGYEGDIRQGWGNSNPLEQLRRFWVGFCRGGYVGHGETYYVPEEILWWSKGGVLRGQTPERIRFLREIMEQAPGPLEPIPDSFCIGAKFRSEFFLLYLETHQPRLVVFTLPEGEFKAEIIDTWEMTSTPLTTTFQGELTIPLTSKPYQLVRIQKIAD